MDVSWEGGICILDRYIDPCSFECNCTLFLLILDLILVLPHGNLSELRRSFNLLFDKENLDFFSLFPDSHGCDYVSSDP